MSRLIIRENALKILYIHLIREEKKIEEIVDDLEFVSTVGDFIEPLTIDDEMLAVIKRAALRKETYGLALNQFLNHWRFDRLGYMEQAILILACSELEIGLQDKAIIVNEAVRISKIYADDDSYRLINGVLDAL
ncbi:transcription antitermination factor NusB [Erysipelothrix urinaevulpis]|uniref:transcription antitermination factor NusB n=1 Tax=Erysipelothrix urinaevulpis TaxID=2683717 RepID=UPI001357493F|nr:transcription antitermination factor NusB [Erysipelothrix urinaevulpis]